MLLIGLFVGGAKNNEKGGMHHVIEKNDWLARMGVDEST